MDTWTRADGARVSSTPEDVSMFFGEDPIFGNEAFDASGDEKENQALSRSVKKLFVTESYLPGSPFLRF